MSKTSMSIRLDSEVKEQAQQVFNSLGMDMTTAINIFLRQAIQYQGLPFDVRLDESRKLMEVIGGFRSKSEYESVFCECFRLDGGFACLRFVIINSLKKILSWL